MKVLWFSNTPASGEEFIGKEVIRGGWLKSLDKLLKSQVELHIAFEYPKHIDPFIYKEIYYYPICKKNWKLAMIKNIINNKIKDKEDLKVYLELIDNIKPDVIHIHGTENPFSAIIDSNIKTPIILSIQGNRTVYHYKYFSGIPIKYYNYRVSNLFNLKQFLFSVNYKKEFQISKKTADREKYYIGKHKNIIGRTDWDRRISRVLAPNSIYFHNDEVLRDSFYREVWNKERDSKIILQSTIGTTFYKGLETVIQSSMLLEKLGLNFEWRIAGIKSNDLIVKIVLKYLKTNRYPSSVIFQGNLIENEIIRSLLESDIFIMPSHIENSPNNLCEAMMIGLPCIATFVGGTSTIIKDNEEGLLIQDGDPWSMTGAILELINNYDQAKIYGTKARERALKRHNKKRIVDDLVAIYQKVIDKA